MLSVDFKLKFSLKIYLSILSKPVTQAFSGWHTDNFSEPTFLGCIDNQIILPTVLHYYAF